MRIFPSNFKWSKNNGATRSSSSNWNLNERLIINAWILSTWKWEVTEYGPIEIRWVKRIIISSSRRTLKLSFITNGLRSRIKAWWWRKWLDLKFTRIIWVAISLSLDKRRISCSWNCLINISCSRWCKNNYSWKHEKKISSKTEISSLKKTIKFKNCYSEIAKTKKIIKKVKSKSNKTVNKTKRNRECSNNIFR